MADTTKAPRLGLWQDVSILPTQRTDLFVLTLPAGDVDVMRFVADGYADVPWTGQGRKHRVATKVLALLGERLQSQLTLNLVDLGAFAGLEHDEDVRVYCHKAVSLAGGKDIAIACSLTAPDPRTERLPEAALAEVANAVGVYGAKAARLDADRALQKAQNEAWLERTPPEQRDTVKRAIDAGNLMPPTTPLPFFDGAKLLPQFPPGVIVKATKRDYESIERAVARAVRVSPFPRHPPPRDGLFDVAIATANPKRNVAMVTWAAHRGLPPFPEMRAALKRRIPIAFSKPRHTGWSRPSIDSAQNGLSVTEPSAVVGFDPDDAAWLDAFDPLRDYDFGERRSRAARARAAAKANGFEAIAWYQAFHTYSDEAWGIYFDAQALDDAVCALADDLRQAGFKRSLDCLASRLVFGMVYQHEAFHARVEAVQTWMELNAGQPRQRAYLDRVYRTLLGTDDCLEEALANHWSWTWFQSMVELQALYGALLENEKAGLTKVVSASLDLSPPGYNQWRRGNDRETWRIFATQLATGKTNLPAPGIGLPIESALRDKLPFDVVPSDVPVYFVGQGQIANQILSSAAVFNVLARRELQRALGRFFRYQLVPGAGKGSHEKWRGEDGRIFPLPVRDPVSHKVFSAFLSHFGIKKADYIERIRPAI